MPCTGLARKAEGGEGMSKKTKRFFLVFVLPIAAAWSANYIFQPQDQWQALILACVFILLAIINHAIYDAKERGKS